MAPSTRYTIRKALSAAFFLAAAVVAALVGADPWVSTSIGILAAAPWAAEL